MVYRAYDNAPPFCPAPASGGDALLHERPFDSLLKVELLPLNVERCPKQLPPTKIDDVMRCLQRGMPRFREEYAVRSLGVFGSFVRGEQRRGNDLDVGIEFERIPGLLRFLELEMELSTLLGLPVDLVQKEALKPAIGRRIVQEVTPV